MATQLPNFTVTVNAFEAGVLMGMIESAEERLKPSLRGVRAQLIAMKRDIEKADRRRMVKKQIRKVFWLPIGFKLDKEWGYFALTFMLLDIRITWRTEYWDWGFTIGTIYGGICFDLSKGWWRYRESLRDFWCA